VVSNSVRMTGKTNPEVESPLNSLCGSPMQVGCSVNNTLIPEQMENIYTSGQYSTSHPTYHVEDSPWKSRQILSMLGRHGLAPQNICEVGCGVGEILRQLQGLMAAPTLFHGFDINPQAIALAQERANGHLRYFCGDFRSAETMKYDLLLCMDVIEHVDDYMGFLRGLRPRSTYKMFHIPLDLSAQTVFRGKPIARQRAVHGHIHYFTKDTALSTLAYAGYELVDWMYTGCGVWKPFGFLNRLMKYPRIILYRFNPDFVVRVLGGYSLLVLTK
jgi:hypothetical protein